MGTNITQVVLCCTINCKKCFFYHTSSSPSIWCTDLRDQYFATRPRTRLLEKITNGRVRDRDFLKIKSEPRPGRDRESRAFSLETETRTWRDLNKFFNFSIFCDETRPETSGKINKRTSPRPRLINNQNWSETETRLRVSVPLVSKTRRDRDSRQSVSNCLEENQITVAKSKEFRYRGTKV